MLLYTNVMESQRGFQIKPGSLCPRTANNKAVRSMLPTCASRQALQISLGKTSRVSHCLFIVRGPCIGDITSVHCERTMD